MTQRAAVMGWRDRLAMVVSRPAVLALLGGLIFLAVFQWRYASINPDLYRYRDDGVITLSHAKNLIDFGFIGVNPSGERVEGFSAPLQFLVYALVYAVSGLGFTGFADLQTAAATFALGAMFVLFFAGRPVFALAACAVAAVVLTALASFMIWHGSGMENALTHVALLGTVFVLYDFARKGRVDRRWVVVPFLASITRLEGIYHVAPLIVVFCLYWHGARKDRAARDFAALFGVLWILFQLARYAYFGTALPNTALAQGISVGERISELLALDTNYLNQSFALARLIFVEHGGYVLLLLTPMLVFRPRNDLLGYLLALCACLVLTALFNPFLFGPTRLDVTRSTTQMALLVVLSVAAAAQGFRLQRFHLYVVPVVFAMVFMVHESSRRVSYNVCCDVKGFEAIADQFAAIARKEGITRATIANPDLGAISWRKQFNIVDLGMLGSPIFAKLRSGPALNDYFFEFAAPDLIESHGWWSCNYRSLLADPRFIAAYAPANADAAKPASCKEGPTPTGIWVRRDVLKASASAERVLIDDLGRNLSTERLATELRQCQQKATAPYACTYVARSAYRLLPEFRRSGDMAALDAVFRESRTRDFDLYLLTGYRDSGAVHRALALIGKPQ